MKCVNVKTHPYLKPLIKWSGTKRYQCESIVSFFPKDIDTYVEPFCGGCSVLHELLYQISNGERTCKKIICSDLNKDVISIFKMLADGNGRDLYNSYKKYFYELVNAAKSEGDSMENIKKYYYKLRDKYNEISTDDEERPHLFFFIMRHAYNGLLRFNKSGKFNSPYHIAGGYGMTPETLIEVITEWDELISSFKEKGGEIEFRYCSYIDIFHELDETNNTVIYLDPPYYNAKSMYQGNFNHTEMFAEIKSLENKLSNVKILMSFDGTSGKSNNTYDSRHDEDFLGDLKYGEEGINILEDLFDEHKYIYNAKSSYKTLNNFDDTKDDMVFDSLYIYNKELL